MPGSSDAGADHDRNAPESAPTRTTPERGVAPVRKAPVDPAGERPRLSKRIGELGLASRREADDWIAAGHVKVDGVVVAELGARVGPDQRIEIDPAAKALQSGSVTVLLHKPLDVVSGQAEDGHEPAITLVTAANQWKDGDASKIRFHRGHLKSLATAGRLDLDSTGLLVLTQDGRVAKALIGADTRIEKEYVVGVEWMEHPEQTNLKEGFPRDRMALLRHGLVLDGEALKPAQVSWQSERVLRVCLQEGKKRQIRRMCEMVGLKVLSLKRIRIGQVSLGELPVGQWRFLAPWEKF